MKNILAKFNIVDLIIIIVDVMLLSKVTVNEFFKKTTKPVKKVYEKTAPIIEERRERRHNQNIDIFLDGEEDNDEPEAEKKTKKRSSKKPADQQVIDDSTTDDGLDDDDMSNLIREIKASTRSNQTEAKPKSIDEIVDNATVEKKPDPEEAIKKAVKDYYDKNGIEYDPSIFPEDHDCEHCHVN